MKDLMQDIEWFYFSHAFQMYSVIEKDLFEEFFLVRKGSAGKILQLVSGIQKGWKKCCIFRVHKIRMGGKGRYEKPFPEIEISVLPGKPVDRRESQILGKTGQEQQMEDVGYLLFPVKLYDRVIKEAEKRGVRIFFREGFGQDFADEKCDGCFIDLHMDIRQRYRNTGFPDILQILFPPIEIESPADRIKKLVQRLIEFGGTQ